MTSSDRVTLYFHPHSRASGTRVLLEELGAPYDIHYLDIQAGDQLKPEFLAINPMGKIPTIVHRGAVVTEQVAVTIYLGDAFPAAGLAPALDDPMRGPYLRWTAFHGACFEPAIVDIHLKRQGPHRSMSPFGDSETAVRVVLDQLAGGDYILGDRFSAADVLWASSLDWITSFGIIEKTPLLAAYLDRVTSRPAFKRVAELNAALLAEKAAAGAA